MTPGTAFECGRPPIFSARLSPYRSLSPTGFVVVMMALVSCSFTAGLAFWMMGAWPVVGFFGLDISLVQLAFRLNYRAARAREEIGSSADRLTVRRTTPNGRGTEFSLNPYWARLEVDRHPEPGVTADILPPMASGSTSPVSSGRTSANSSPRPLDGACHGAGASRTLRQEARKNWVVRARRGA